MDEMIREMHSRMMRSRDTEKTIEEIVHEEVSQLLEGFEERLEEKEYEKLHDDALIVAVMAEEEGFVKGFRCGVRLFMECICED